MNIKEVAREINPMFVMKILALNEISGNENAICRFSYAGGKSAGTWKHWRYGRQLLGQDKRSFNGRCT